MIPQVTCPHHTSNGTFVVVDGVRCPTKQFFQAAAVLPATARGRTAKRPKDGCPASPAESPRPQPCGAAEARWRRSRSHDGSPASSALGASATAAACHGVPYGVLHELGAPGLRLSCSLPRPPDTGQSQINACWHQNRIPPLRPLPDRARAQPRKPPRQPPRTSTEKALRQQLLTASSARPSPEHVCSSSRPQL